MTMMMMMIIIVVIIIIYSKIFAINCLFQDIKEYDESQNRYFLQLLYSIRSVVSNLQIHFYKSILGIILIKLKIFFKLKKFLTNSCL